MKYIRTKDGIYKYADYLGVHNGKRYALMDDAQGNRITMCQEPEELYKSANTIEELCDEFVWVSIENECHNRKANEYGLRTSRMQVNCPQIKCIYGAIWIQLSSGSWGLKPVAKMNEKGEMELL